MRQIGEFTLFDSDRAGEGSRTIVKRSAMVSLAFIAVAIVVASVGATTASACSTAAHCYGILDWAPSGSYDGAIAYLTATRLTTSAPASRFVDHEMWVNTDSAAWVEAGLTHGAINGVNHGRAFFWAEQNTVGSYAEHFVQTISLGTTYIAKISYSGSGRWGVYLNGTNLGASSANHSATTFDLQTGAELEANDDIVSGTMGSLQKRAASAGTWSYNWPSTNFVQNSPATAGWTTQYTDAWDSAN